MKSHMMCETKLYKSWARMNNRCRNHPKYKDIVFICDEWKKFETFMEWANHNGYKDGLSLDRINNNLGYHPDNCRWITLDEQKSNRRCVIQIFHNNETHTMVEWAKITGIKYKTLWMRFNRRNYSIEKALTK